MPKQPNPLPAKPTLQDILLGAALLVALTGIGYCVYRALQTRQSVRTLTTPAALSMSVAQLQGTLRKDPGFLRPYVGQYLETEGLQLTRASAAARPGQAAGPPNPAVLVADVVTSPGALRLLVTVVDEVNAEPSRPPTLVRLAGRSPLPWYCERLRIKARLKAIDYRGGSPHLTLADGVVLARMPFAP